MDPPELEVLLSDLSRVIFRHLVKIGASRPDAEDIVQETVFRWLSSADSIAPGKVPSWMFRVALNLYYDLCRKWRRSPSVQLTEDLVVDDQDTPEAAALRDERHSRVRKAFSTLSVTEQHLLVLKYSEGLSYAQIGLILGRPPSTVSTYLYRARQKYRSAFEEED